MPMKQGETYTCPCDTCDCTIQVLLSAPADCPGTAPTCCCGKAMVKSER